LSGVGEGGVVPGGACVGGAGSSPCCLELGLQERAKKNKINDSFNIYSLLEI